MATEAQRLIGISLTKIAQSRAHRGGVSLHKNLLVATVLQKARYIFMEEAYHMVHAGNYCQSATAVQQQQQQQSQQSYDDDDDDEEEDLIALTPEEAGITTESTSSSSSTVTVTATFQELLQPNCTKCNNDKENVPPPYQNQTELTYLDLDHSSSVHRSETGTNGSTCLKRRRAVTEWETEEAVLSILPKKSKHKSEDSSAADEDDDDDSVFLDETLLFSDSVTKEADSAPGDDTDQNGTASSVTNSMEIDRITSLVSIFSFGNLSRSVSTPDLCSAQAKESVDALQQRPFLAMTV